MVPNIYPAIATYYNSPYFIPCLSMLHFLIRVYWSLQFLSKKKIVKYGSPFFFFIIENSICDIKSVMYMR